MIVKDWGKYAPFFTKQEFVCKHTGKCEMQEEFMDKLLAMRKEYNKPMVVSSGYRHWSHPVERSKGHKNGEHTKGLCADISVGYADADELLGLSYKHGFTRRGVNQKGSGRFLHLGLGGEGLATPALWSY